MADLISRASALNAIDCWHIGFKSMDGSKVQMDCWRTIKELPAVDAAPVIHGRWIETTIPANTTGHGGMGQDKKKGWLCSNCRCAFDAKLLWYDNYCPNCGARMDGEQRLAFADQSGAEYADNPTV